MPTVELTGPVIWIIVGLLFVFFALTSTIKMFAWQRKVFETQMDFMRLYGISRGAFFMIGVIEFLGAVSIWFQQSWIGLVGACLLCGTSLGAVSFHARFDSLKNGIPAVVTGLLSGLLIAQNFNVISAG